ncbi:MAG TPA: hypothetical protein VI318_04040 [Baekduia sp.]
MEHTSVAAGGGSVRDLVLASIAEYGWTTPDLGVDRARLVSLADDVIRAAQKAKRDLPQSPESQFIQDAINRQYGTSARKGAPGDLSNGGPTFASFSFERHCLEQAVLILTQIDPSERQEAFGREMTVVVGPEYATYGLVFAPNTVAGNAHSMSFQTRLRSNDLTKLQTATSSYVSAVNPTRREGRIRNWSSPGASVGRRTNGSVPFVSKITRLEIRSVANERLFTGEPIPVTGRFSLLRRTLSRGATVALLLLSLLFFVASAVLFAVAPDTGWWMWAEQLMGRLATGAFGALLVDSAIDYTALRRSLMAGTGRVTHGAIIDWDRAGAP